MLKTRQTRQSKQAANAKLAAIHAANIAIVTAGKCPQCGAGIRRNRSMTGWYQCQQFGAVGFRADASKPSCSYQCFTA